MLPTLNPTPELLAYLQGRADAIRSLANGLWAYPPETTIVTTLADVERVYGRWQQAVDAIYLARYTIMTESYDD